MTPIPWPAPYSGSTFDTSGSGLYYQYFYSLHVPKGKTIKFELSAMDYYGWLYFYPQGDPAWSSASAEPGPQVVNRGLPTKIEYTIMAPRDHDYYVLVESEDVATYTVNAHYVSPTAFKFQSIWVPKKARPYIGFGVSAKITPRYNSFDVPVRFEVKRLRNGKFRWYKDFKATWGSPVSTGTYSRYVSTLSLRAGTYRVRAVFKDAAHKTMVTGWKKLVVK